eukprot:GHVU01199379.1.p1 GENE.GHVU01199379.1~~GHVU01199379.1.p1  ORF type:complete len:260 (-),score=16.29 GHVU01199379.1:730-1509(-)
MKKGLAAFWALTPAEIEKELHAEGAKQIREREAARADQWVRSRLEQDTREDRWRTAEGDSLVRQAVSKAKERLSATEYRNWSEKVIGMAPMTGRRTSDRQTPPGRNPLRESRTDEAARRLVGERRGSASTPAPAHTHISDLPARSYAQPPSTSSSSNNTTRGATSVAGVEISPVNSQDSSPDVPAPILAHAHTQPTTSLVADPVVCEDLGKTLSDRARSLRLFSLCALVSYVFPLLVQFPRMVIGIAAGRRTLPPAQSQ